MPRDLRLEDQIDFLRDALDEAEAFPPSWREDGDVQYLYREGCLLVRSADVDPVLTGLVAVLRGGGEEGEEEEIRRSVQVEPVFQGVTRLRYRTREENDRPSVPDALTQLDDSLGIGTARPESVVFGCGHACPAAPPPARSPGRHGHSRIPRSPAGRCRSRGCRRVASARRHRSAAQCGPGPLLDGRRRG